MKELYKTIEQQSKTIKRFNRGEYGLCEYRASSFPHLYSNSWAWHHLKWPAVHLCMCLPRRLMFPTSPLTAGHTSKSLIKLSVKDSPQEVPLFQLGVMHFVLTSSQLPLCSCVITLTGILETAVLRSYADLLDWLSGFNMFIFKTNSFAYEIWLKEPHCNIADASAHVIEYRLNNTWVCHCSLGMETGSYFQPFPFAKNTMTVKRQYNQNMFSQVNYYYELVLI